MISIPQLIDCYLHVLLLFTSSLTIPTSSSTVTVDHSLTSLLKAVHHLPKPHPNLTVVLSRQLVGAGFHRSLLTQVEEVTSQSSSRHTTSDGSLLHVAFVENVTCDMYVDVDQVAFLADFGGPDLVASSHMDTEKPASVSPHHVVMTFTSVGGKVDLPLHFRYQAPSPSNSPYKTVTIPPPTVFVLTSQLPKQLQKNSIRLPCNPSSNSDKLCLWTRTQVHGINGYNDDELELMAEIPQGLEEHKAVAVGLTVFMTLAATVLIAYTFVRVKERTESGKKNQ